MAEKPSEQDDKEAEARFNETLGRLLNTPHTPHKPTAEPKPTRNPAKPE
jgi:hypothetical protein